MILYLKIKSGEMLCIIGSAITSDEDTDEAVCSQVYFGIIIILYRMAASISSCFYAVADHYIMM